MRLSRSRLQLGALVHAMHEDIYGVYRWEPYTFMCMYFAVKASMNTVSPGAVRLQFLSVHQAFSFCKSAGISLVAKENIVILVGTVNSVTSQTRVPPTAAIRTSKAPVFVPAVCRADFENLVDAISEPRSANIGHCVNRKYAVKFLTQPLEWLSSFSHVM